MPHHRVTKDSRGVGTDERSNEVVISVEGRFTLSKRKKGKTGKYDVKNFVLLGRKEGIAEQLQW